MKKQSILPLFFFVFVGFTVQAQFSLGPGIIYGFEVEEIGVQARGVYSFNDTWRGEADFIYYLEGDDFVSYWELNLNGNYVFLNSERSLLYALAGVNVFHVNFDVVGGNFGFEGSTTESGINIGAGGQITFSEKVSGFGEVKYVIGDADQLLLAAGALFHF